MGDLPRGDALRFPLYQLHKSLGITVLLLVALRLCWRWRHPPPPLPEAMPAWQRTASLATHRGLYALLVATPLAGWSMVSSVSPERNVPTLLYGWLPWPHLPLGTGVFDTAQEVHEILAWTLLVLAALHFAAALGHRFVAKDQVLQRMLVHRRVSALALAALALVALGYLWSMSPASGSPPAAAAPAPAATTVTGPHWRADGADGALRFSGELSGQRFDGHFAEFTVRMDLAADRAKRPFVDAVVQIDSVDSADAERDELIRGPDWFDVPRYPQAVFRAESVIPLGDGRYRADGQLRIRDVSRPASVEMRYRRDGASAQVDGWARLDRSEFHLGQRSWADESWVAHAVAVEFSLRLHPAP